MAASFFGSDSKGRGGSSYSAVRTCLGPGWLSRKTRLLGVSGAAAGATRSRTGAGCAVARGSGVHATGGADFKLIKIVENRFAALHFDRRLAPSRLGHVLHSGGGSRQCALHAPLYTCLQGDPGVDDGADGRERKTRFAFGVVVVVARRLANGKFMSLGFGIVANLRLRFEAIAGGAGQAQDRAH